ncbi:hypothetical protein QFZ99_004204 [Paraburkholderia atlantica]
MPIRHPYQEQCGGSLMTPQTLLARIEAVTAA